MIGICEACRNVGEAVDSADIKVVSSTSFTQSEPKAKKQRTLDYFGKSLGYTRHTR